MLREVENMVKKHYPDYELAADHLSHYRDMKLVTFAVDQKAHSLIVAFPAFIKEYRKPPLGQGFFICWITLHLLKFQSAAIGKKNKKTLMYSSTPAEYVSDNFLSCPDLIFNSIVDINISFYFG